MQFLAKNLQNNRLTRPLWELAPPLPRKILEPPLSWAAQIMLSDTKYHQGVFRVFNLCMSLMCTGKWWRVRMLHWCFLNVKLSDIPVIKKRCCIGSLSASDLFYVLSITLHFPGGKCLILLVWDTITAALKMSTSLKVSFQQPKAKDLHWHLFYS